jgi:predicted PilT family ATPase
MSNKFDVEVNDSGFTVWNNSDSRWVIDGSTFNDDWEITVAMDNFTVEVVGDKLRLTFKGKV